MGCTLDNICERSCKWIDFLYLDFVIDNDAEKIKRRYVFFDKHGSALTQTYTYCCIIVCFVCVSVFASLSLSLSELLHEDEM